MTRTEIIQLLIDRYDLKSYIEIGTQFKKNNFDKIRCEYKLSVDPDLNSDADIHLTSDDFFTFGLFNNPVYNSNKIDIWFIDGLHEKEQVEKDINNSFKNISDNGFIVVHDCNPTSELVQRVPRESKQWTGDVWKTIVELRARSDLRMYTVDTDWGCCVIRKGKQIPINRKEELTYENLDKNRREWLNLVSVDYFKQLHK